MTKTVIIDKLTRLALAQIEKCNSIIECLGYYEQLEDYKPSKIWLPWKKNVNCSPFESIPLCWEGPFSYGGSITWVMIAGLCLEVGELYAEIYNYHSLPPDFGAVPIEMVPSDVLQYLLDAINNERNRYLATCYDDAIQWLSELPHSQREIKTFLLGKGQNDREVLHIQRLLMKSPFI